MGMNMTCGYLKWVCSLFIGGLHTVCTVYWRFIGKGRTESFPIHSGYRWILSYIWWNIVTCLTIHVENASGFCLVFLWFCDFFTSFTEQNLWNNIEIGGQMRNWRGFNVIVLRHWTNECFMICNKNRFPLRLKPFQIRRNTFLWNIFAFSNQFLIISFFSICCR